MGAIARSEEERRVRGIDHDSLRFGGSTNSMICKLTVARIRDADATGHVQELVPARCPDPGALAALEDQLSHPPDPPGDVLVASGGCHCRRGGRHGREEVRRGGGGGVRRKRCEEGGPDFISGREPTTTGKVLHERL